MSIIKYQVSRWKNSIRKREITRETASSIFYKHPNTNRERREEKREMFDSYAEAIQRIRDRARLEVEALRLRLADAEDVLEYCEALPNEEPNLPLDKFDDIQFPKSGELKL